MDTLETTINNIAMLTQDIVENNVLWNFHECCIKILFPFK